MTVQDEKQQESHEWAGESCTRERQYSFCRFVKGVPTGHMEKQEMEMETEMEN